MGYQPSPVCNDTRVCFAKRKALDGRIKCEILKATYKNDGECPFCKHHPAFTNGQFYPHRDTVKA